MGIMSSVHACVGYSLIPSTSLSLASASSDGHTRPVGTLLAAAHRATDDDGCRCKARRVCNPCGARKAALPRSTTATSAAKAGNNTECDFAMLRVRQGMDEKMQLSPSSRMSSNAQSSKKPLSHTAQSMSFAG